MSKPQPDSHFYAVLPDVHERFKPPTNMSSSEKTIWTERKLMQLQNQLREVFEECGNTEVNIGRKKRNKSEVETQPFVGCNSCSRRKCNSIIDDMFQYLLPYAESIYKNSFIAFSTLEEMERVVLESISDFLTDIWGKKKYIDRSFGASLKWKMVYLLYGDSSIYNSPDILCIDSESDSMNNPNSDDDNVYNLFYQLAQTTTSFTPDLYQNTRRADILDHLMSSLFSYRTELSKYLTPHECANVEMRVVHGVCRLLSNKETYSIFHNQPKAQYYYYKFVDFMHRFLIDYTQGDS
jgi:hypothetical protein